MTASTRAKSGSNHLIAAQRRSEAVRLRLAGATLEEIADKLGVTPPAVGKMLRRAITLWQQETEADVSELRALQYARLEKLLMNTVARIEDEGLSAIEAARKVLADERKLLGLDAPVRTDITTNGESLNAIGETRERLLATVARIRTDGGSE